jgi:hypothetical protein
MEQGKYSANALANFLEYAADKGLLKRATARSRKIASMKILEALDEDDKKDLREINIDDAFNRFQNLASSSLKPESLAVYKSRFTSALNDFLRWNENPATFRSSTVARSARTAEGIGGNVKRAHGGGIKEKKFGGHTKTDHHTGLIFPVPIREGVVVSIANIPSDLTKEEATKIAAVVHALAASEKK